MARMKFNVIHNLGIFKTYSISFERVNSPFPFVVESDTFCQAIQEAKYFMKYKDDPTFWEEWENL